MLPGVGVSLLQEVEWAAAAAQQGGAISKATTWACKQKTSTAKCQCFLVVVKASGENYTTLQKNPLSKHGCFALHGIVTSSYTWSHAGCWLHQTVSAPAFYLIVRADMRL